MAVIVNIPMESDLNEWTSLVSDDCTWSASAGLASTAGGMLVTIDDTTSTYGEKSGLSSSSGKARARFYIDPNSLTMANPSNHYIFQIRNAVGAIGGALLYFTAAGHGIRGFITNDAAANTTTGTKNITDEPHFVEIYIQRAATDVSADGSIQLWVDGVSQETVSGIDNFDQFVNTTLVRMGAVLQVDATTSGTYFMDELVVNDDGSEIGAVGGGAVNITAAENTQAQASDIANLTATYLLTAAENTQAQVSDTATLTVIDVIAPAENTQSQASDAASISYSGVGDVNITAAENNQAQISDAAMLAAIHVVTGHTVLLAHTIDPAVLTFEAPTYSITPAENFQAQVSDAATLTAIYILAAVENHQTQISALAVLTIGGTFEHGERRLYEFDTRGNSVFAKRPTHATKTRADLEVND